MVIDQEYQQGFQVKTQVKKVVRATTQSTLLNLQHSKVMLMTLYSWVTIYKKCYNGSLQQPNTPSISTTLLAQYRGHLPAKFNSNHNLIHQ